MIHALRGCAGGRASCVGGVVFEVFYLLWVVVSAGDDTEQEGVEQSVRFVVDASCGEAWWPVVCWVVSAVRHGAHPGFPAYLALSSLNVHE